MLRIVYLTHDTPMGSVMIDALHEAIQQTFRGEALLIRIAYDDQEQSIKFKVDDGIWSPPMPTEPKIYPLLTEET